MGAQRLTLITALFGGFRRGQFNQAITATVLCVFAYGGLPQGLDFASEMEDPRRSVAQSVRKTTLLVSVAYVMFGIAAVRLVPVRVHPGRLS